MEKMFAGSKKVQTLNLSGWNVENVTDFEKMFDGCHELESIQMQNWNMSKESNKDFMFDDCYALPKAIRKIPYDFH
jgi:surface protein